MPSMTFVFHQVAVYRLLAPKGEETIPKPFSAMAQKDEECHRSISNIRGAAHVVCALLHWNNKSQQDACHMSGDVDTVFGSKVTSRNRAGHMP